MPSDQDQRLSDAINRERGRLRNFIRRQVPDEADAEDILQEVFYELVEAYRAMKPIEHAGAWLFQVARNRIIDLFRRKKPQQLSAQTTSEDSLNWEDLLPSPDAGPDAEYARSVLVEQLDAALDELPEDLRDVFLAHEFEGHSFRELSAKTGLSENTLRSRKHYAVLHLRKRLQTIYDEFTRR
jgi:RNA polymerase sigma factor (sigma-70 family)